MFVIFVNGKQVGTVADESEAGNLLLEARKRLNANSTELTFAQGEIECEGHEMIWGKVDRNETIIANMVNVLSLSSTENLNRAYEVKIKGNIITLESKEEVLKLLQAAIDKYDEEHQFTVSLISDQSRELPVMIPFITTKEEAKEMEVAKQAVQMYSGLDKEMTDLFNNIQPNIEKEFEDYDTGVISIEYGSPIEVVEVYAEPQELDNVDAAITDITQEVLNNEIYKVVSGDTLSGIALKVGIPMEDIIKMNDSLEDQNSMIHPDDELVITIPKPKLAIRRVEEVLFDEDYTPETEYIYNDEWYTTDKVVHQQPSDGHHRGIAMITYENDDEVSREVIDEEITYQPVPMIMEKGTKIPPSYIKPIYGGRITSRFGYRKRPTKGASTYHKGIDWATPVGTTVMASCGGTVAKAGWGSGYGNVIYINHPGGRQTRYGHLSKILVSVGQTVSQGQKIALSGNTGVSTGPHIHFEILINGSHVNPLNYLSY